MAATAPGGFMAIDFETAGRFRASACSVGWAIYDAGQLLDSGASLIDPQLPEDDWSWFNVSIHGIEPADVRGAPVFDEIWAILLGRSEGRPLVAHYAGFDVGVLRAELTRAGISPEPMRYACSGVLARRTWPEMVSVSLPVIARELAIDLRHHDAESDAVACGAVASAVTKHLVADDLDAALAAHALPWGEIRTDLTWHPCGVTGLRLSEMRAQFSDFDPAHPLLGQTIAFTGALSSMTRREAFQRLLDCGGMPAVNVTKETNILVVGEQDLARLAAGHTMSGKHRKAAAYRASGLDIQLIGEVDFLEAL